MSKYTTGELAKLCGVTVRTVQYYDTRNILIPSELSEGGRRLYSEEDLRKMKIICFLRDIGLPINSIEQLLSEEDPASVISLLLEQQGQALRSEIEEQQAKLNKLEKLNQELKLVEHFSVESIGDIVYRMANKKKLHKLYISMMAVGIVAEIIEDVSLVYGIVTGNWWPFAVGLPIVIGITAWMIWYYFKHVSYICPKCHAVYKPRFREFFFARHTINTRRLTCTECGHKGFCVETYHREEK